MTAIAANTSRLIDSLPEELQRAQHAIGLPEVAAMIKALAKFNLGVCMPHFHSAMRDFDVLPPGMVQSETNQVVTFVPAATANTTASIPVAWRWQDNGDGVGCVARCNCCVPHTATSQHNI